LKLEDIRKPVLQVLSWKWTNSRSAILGKSSTPIVRGKMPFLTSEMGDGNLNLEKELPIKTMIY